jgi:site-specific recombinase XerD
MDNDKLLKVFLSYLKMKGTSINTQNGYERDLRHLFSMINKLALEINFKDLNSYFLGLVADGKSPRTLNRKMAAVRCFFKFLLKNEYITTDPSTKLESSKIPKRLPEYLTHEKVLKIIDATECFRDKVIMMVLYTTGARLSEIHRLNRNDIDFTNKQIIVIGKGNKQGTVYLNQIACDMLKQYLDSRTDDCEALFVNNQNERLGKRYIQKMVKKCGLKAGIEGVHPHLYRHSLASRMAMEGIQIQTIQEILRHESISTTQLYAHLSKEKIRSDYDKIFEKRGDK